MPNLLNWYYWFDFRPGLLSQSTQSIVKFLLLVLGLLLLISLIYLNWRRRDRILSLGIKKVSSWCTMMIIAGFLFYWFNYEGVPFFSARFWWAIWLLSALAWLIKIIIFFVKDLPVKKAQWKKNELFKQYAPHIKGH